MGDLADNADKAIADHLEAAIRAARGVMPADTRSAEVCEECGLEISSARQIAVPGCVLCTDCAEVVESLRRRGLL
jgi:phage/conjugal plasmid C-4 type zinc finger TraR family protein